MSKDHKFNKHILLKEIGTKGQEKINKAKMLIIGLGGLGSPCVRYLASSGVNNFCLIDDDIIELDNLARQNNYCEEDIDKGKVEVTAKIIKTLNPKAQIELISKRLEFKLLAKYANNYDLIIDASDNFKTKFMLSDIATEQNKTLISGSFLGFNGYVSVYKQYYDNNLPCFRCFHHEEIDVKLEKACYKQGVFSPGVGVVGTFMAAEVLKEIIGIKETMAGKMMIFDFIKNNHRLVKVKKRKSCMCSFK